MQPWSNPMTNADADANRWKTTTNGVAVVT
jgi:hypothetical protein